MHPDRGQTWKRFFEDGLFKFSKFLLGLWDRILLKCYLHFPSLPSCSKPVPLAEKILQMFGAQQLHPTTKDYRHRAAGRESNPGPANGLTCAGQGFTRHIPALFHTLFHCSLEPKIQLNRPARYHSEKCRCFPVCRCLTCLFAPCLFCPFGRQHLNSQLQHQLHSCCAFHILQRTHGPLLHLHPLRDLCFSMNSGG